MTAHQPKTSQLLIELSESFADDKTITLHEILKKLDGRAFGLLLFALAAPNCIPNIPGISTIFGLLLIAPALQLIFGAGQVWLPKKVREMEIKSSTLRLGIEKSLPILTKIEKLVCPRLEFLTQKPFTIILGIQVLILAFILLLPIPFGNMVPGMGIAIIAIGLIQRDGVLILISIILAAFSFIMAYFGLGASIAALKWLIDAILRFFGS